MVRDALAREPRLYAMGMGGWDKPLPQMLKRLRWKICEVPFHFKVCHSVRFLHHIRALRTSGLRSKIWNEFARAGAPVIDFVFTVCDQAAGELCPLWPGNPVTAHWGVPDSAAVQGTEAEQRRAFREAYVVLENRIKLFVALPFEKLDRMAIKRNVDEIGRRAASKRELS